MRITFPNACEDETSDTLGLVRVCAKHSGCVHCRPPALPSAAREQFGKAATTKLPSHVSPESSERDGLVSTWPRQTLQTGWPWVLWSSPADGCSAGL